MKTFHEKISKSLDASPEEVWKVIGAVEGVDKWFPSMIKSCNIENGKRYCETAEGLPLEEDILEVNHETRTFRFGIPQQEMLPAESIVEVMQVSDGDDGKAVVVWSADFQSSAESAPIVQSAFRQLWDQGLTEMEHYIKNN